MVMHLLYPTACGTDNGFFAGAGPLAHTTMTTSGYHTTGVRTSAVSGV